VLAEVRELLVDVLFDFDRQLFSAWWDDAVAFVRANARQGSDLAAQCLREYEERPEPCPHPAHRLFRPSGYANVSKRDERDEFVHRDRFYSQGREFSDEYARRLKRHLCGLAGDLFG